MRLALQFIIKYNSCVNHIDTVGKMTSKPDETKIKSFATSRKSDILAGI